MTFIFKPTSKLVEIIQSVNSEEKKNPVLPLLLPEIFVLVHQNAEVQMEIKHTENSLKKQTVYLPKRVAIISCAVLAKLRNTQS